MFTTTYDRHQGDVANIIGFEHVNVTVPDLTIATWFYVNALGFTRDPYVDLGPDLIWINLGRQQFHLPAGDPQIVRGTIEVVVPNLAALETRLDAMADYLKGTKFEVRTDTEVIDVSGPWGNRFRCCGPDRTDGFRPDGMQLGMRAVDFDVPRGSSSGIGRFYEQVIGASATVNGGCCTVQAGPGQVFRFCETDDVSDYDGHHVAIYVSNFSQPHAWLDDHDLIMEESDEHQYRFRWIVDPDSGERLFELEHEVRSMHHRLFQRPLINRNPDQNLRNYVPGADAFQPRYDAAESYRAVRDVLSTAG